VKPRSAALQAIAAAILLAAGPRAAAAPPAAGAQDLAVGSGDLRIEAREDGGYDLYVRKKPGLGSILLTESTKDPAMKADNFAYRAVEHNEVNGDELRMLNGKALPPSSKLYSLISSTARPDPGFGEAFRILIPPVLTYGYPWSRSGSVAVGKGTFINIRSFAKPYADYSGAFLDNPYEISISTIPALPPPKSLVLEAPQQPQKESPPPPPDDRTSAKIGAAIEAGGESLDLVVCLDTTDSMVPYIDDIKKNLGPIIRAKVAGFKAFRVGLVLYKDYWPDDYISQKYPFTKDISAFEGIVKGIRVMGGRDIPEAEVEALYAAATEFDWSADRRQIILVSDAPPHPMPRGKLYFEDVAREAAARRIELAAITEPSAFPVPNPDHPRYENELKAIAIMANNAIKPRLAAISLPPPVPGDAGSSAAAAAASLALLDGSLLAPLAAEPGVEALRPARSLAPLAIDAGSAPPAGAAGPTAGAAAMAAAAALDKAALAQASAIGANYALLSRTSSSGAFSETVSRLIEIASGKELARDVAWAARSEASEALFVNGARVR
jgi:hypothetical protein